MGLLDSIFGTALGSISTNQRSPLMNMALGLIQNHPQGLQGVVDQFIQSGMAQQAQSWIGSGANMPISAQQLVQALGSGRLEALAQQFGVPAGTAAGGLAALLPQLIDHVTPNGEIPHPTQVSQQLDVLKNAQ
jgi:uncharacterized protein YidB (DUF937 family)